MKLRVHPDARVAAPLSWRRGEARGPFQGAFFEEEAALVEALALVPEERLASARLLGDARGWFLLLEAGDMPAAGAHPLRRAGLVYAPADAAASPLFGGAREGAAGIVREGRVEWVRFRPDDCLRAEDLLRLPEARAEFAAAAAGPMPPKPEPPRFRPEAVPPVARFEDEQRRALERTPEPKRSLWERIFKRQTPPTGREWRRAGGRPADEPGFLHRAIRSFWSWVDRKVGPAPSGQGPGWIRKVFDPDQWGPPPAWLQRIFDRQAALLDRLARAFESGDIDTALKHSIPMDDDVFGSLRRGGMMSTTVSLPEHGTDFSLDGLRERGGPGGAIEMSGDRLQRLLALYRRAAQQLEARGDHRRAAYVHAHLLRDYTAAAQSLERGGFHLEAAALILEKLKNARQAAQVLERGGHFAEAAEVHVGEADFEAAAGAYERGGMAAEARACVEKWVGHLREQRRRIDAGDVLWRRLGRLDAAAAEFKVELAAGGQRGTAAGRLVALAHDRGADAVEQFELCDGVLRAQAEDGARFAASAGELVRFHGDVRVWARAEELPAERLSRMRRRTRESLVEVVRRAESNRAPSVRDEAVARLTEALGEGALAVEDLRRGLALSAPARSPARRAEAAGFAGGVLWSGSRFVVTDGSGAARSPARHMPYAAHAMVANGSLVAVLGMDGQLEIMRVDGDVLWPERRIVMRDVRSVAPGPSAGTFVAGTEAGSLVRVHASGEPRVISPEAGPPVRCLVPWGAPEMLLAGGPSLDLSMWWVEEDDARLLGTLPAPPGGVRLAASHGPTAFLWSGSMFALLRWRPGGIDGGRVDGLPVHGVGAVAACGPDEMGRPVVAAAVARGRVVVATLAAQGPPEVVRMSTVETGLVAVSALAPLGGGALLAVGPEFATAAIDVREPRVVRQVSSIM